MSHQPEVTAIEELLAEEERGAAQAAAKKAKKQRQKARKQQQNEASQHQQPEQQHQPEQQQQQESEHEQLLDHQLQQPTQHAEALQSPLQPSTERDSIRPALAKMSLSGPPLMAREFNPVSGMANHGKADLQAADIRSEQCPEAPTSHTLTSSDLFLQDLFCCPLTKVSSCGIAI